MPLSHELVDLRNELRDLRDDIREIGEKVAKTDVIVATWVDAFKQERAGAATYRQEMRAAMTALSDDFSTERENARQHYTDLTQVIAALSGAVKTLAEKVGEMKPTVDAIVIQKHERAGAHKLWKRQWAGIAAAAAFVSWLLGYLVGWWPALWNAIFGRH
jgi:uncharacterized protein YukE